MKRLGWINKVGTTKLCLRSSRDINGQYDRTFEYVVVYTGEAGGGYRPKLTVNYHSPSQVPRIDNHATAVAGIVASTDFTYKGIAWGVPGLWSANAKSYYDSDLIEAIEWALDKGANVLNNSYGQDTGLEMQAMDRYLDYVVLAHYITGDTARGRTFQIVEFTAPYTGGYVAKVTIHRFDGGVNWPEDLALAYCRA